VLIELFNEDCLPAMKRYPDKYFEMAIVDPPYGLGFDGEVESMVSHRLDSRWRNRHGSGYIRKEWDKEIPSQNYFNELYRISKNQIIWGANHFTLPISRGWIYWDKGVAADFTLSDGELAWTSFKKPIRCFRFLWAGFRKEEPETRIHPTQKPVKLYEWLLKNYAKQGDKILDTHFGSGSIAIACYNLDFSLTGFEIDKDYFDGAVNRLEEHKKQGRLFDATVMVR